MRNGSFQAKLAAFGDATMDRHSRLQRAVSIELFGAIINDTPVDTGRLAANWQTSLNEPLRGELDDEGRAIALSKVTSVATGATSLDKIIMTNSLPYAARIEYDGWSKRKSPQGMVQRNIARFKRILKEQLTAARYKSK